MGLTRHTKFCTCKHSPPKQIWAYAGACASAMPFIDRPKMGIAETLLNLVLMKMVYLKTD